MGVMIDGSWDPERDNLVEDESGEYIRSEAAFRNRIEPGGEHPPAAGRYHLYVSRACPWAHRTMVVRALKGLEDAVTVDILDPVRVDNGWEFTPAKDDCTADSVNGYDYLREVYAAGNPDYTGRVTVPVLWDREAGTIVNNESSEVIQLLDEGLDAYAERDVKLFPPDQREMVIETIEELYEPINNGVYKAGFAQTQVAHEEAVDALFAALAEWNDRLAEQRYACGDQLTAADVCLFTTLYRFDEVYHTHFKCNVRRLTDFTHLWAYTRELYQLPGVIDTCNMDHCKQHYYRSHPDINPGGLIPHGPAPAFDRAHGRAQLSGGPPRALQAAGD